MPFPDAVAFCHSQLIAPGAAAGPRALGVLAARPRGEVFFMVMGLTMAALAPVGPAAANGGSSQQSLARLEQGGVEVNMQLAAKSGGMQRVELRRQREQIEDAMRRLKAGQKVTPEEIDQILGEVSFERAQ